MQFINEAPLYKIIRIAGPKHNLLGLELTTEPLRAVTDVVTMEALDNISNTEKRLDEDEVLAQVMAGVDRAKSMFSRDFHIKRIQYVSTDTPSPDIYKDLTVEILTRIEALQH